MNEAQRLAHEEELVRYGVYADDLHKAVSELGPDEVRVLAYIAKRLVMGLKEYGPLRIASDKRDWRSEMAQECGDLAVYGAIDMLSRTMKEE